MKVPRYSVKGANHYEVLDLPDETIAKVMGGRPPKLLMPIHSISDVNDPGIDLSKIPGPATSDVFNKKQIEEKKD
jgi:NADH-quinone oxidoreductase subunit G